MDDLLAEIDRCTRCAARLPHPPRPVVSAHPASRILIIGQAPGRLVHASGVPWQDRSGDRLREWLGVDAATFYDPRNFALMPMGFCFPGSGPRGDLPPRPECAPLWHQRLRAALTEVKLTLLVGRHALAHYLPVAKSSSLADTVKTHACSGARDVFALPHPSPRNRVWLAHNPWFAAEVVPKLQVRVAAELAR
ncbi:uracil-DNA glycosylase family protein [Actomonas aquatica]|uniref:Uracil-DNA glycosylase family protein n=1 Tax=Actomonas aquatica TaxID=2866162 RepID=A0ABZ1C4P3_9BACT|nr:uracil-DNA glycosylase family protein [Opitutus sp. WL0086]WRQ86213.1 uracil-DNA glycosylase family protein [Opitutus sp. WL0086]